MAWKLVRRCESYSKIVYVDLTNRDDNSCLISMTVLQNVDITASCICICITHCSAG